MGLITSQRTQATLSVQALLPELLLPMLGAQTSLGPLSAFAGCS